MKIDMSPLAVSTRLKRASQLRELCLALAGPRLKRPWGVPARAAVPRAAEEQTAPNASGRRAEASKESPQ